MKITVISYSLTGNNGTIANKIAAEFGAEHIVVTESRQRTMSTIFFDILFNRTPRVNPPPDNIAINDVVLFVGPVWMGQAATPLRAYFKHLKGWQGRYAFVSVSGGADGANPKLVGELTKRMGKKLAAFIDMHIADLLPPDPKPTRNDTMAYRLSSSDADSLTNTIVQTLRSSLAV